MTTSPCDLRFVALLLDPGLDQATRRARCHAHCAAIPEADRARLAVGLLHAAIRARRYCIAEMLIDMGANPRDSGTYGCTALHVAIPAYGDPGPGHERLLRRLLGERCGVHTLHRKEFYSPLEKAAARSDPSTVALFLSRSRPLHFLAAFQSLQRAANDNRKHGGAIEEMLGSWRCKLELVKSVPILARVGAARL